MIEKFAAETEYSVGISSMQTFSKGGYARPPSFFNNKGVGVGGGRCWPGLNIFLSDVNNDRPIQNEK